MGVTHHDRDDRRENDDISIEESRETRSARLDLPRACRPTAEDSGDEGAALYVEVFRSEEGKVIGRGDRVGRDIGTEGGETKGKRAEESGSPIRPEGDDHGGIPEESTVYRLTS